MLAAKQQLEKANGVPEIIKKYITNYNGKYLVFCKDKKHLYAMKDVVIGWFREAGYDGKIFEYPYYSDSSTVKKNLENFENNKEDGLKLLFIIDKLNEGLHLDEVHGCILIRPTGSNIIYYQQIGRAIDAGSMEKRVILDLVSNFNSLKSFNLKKELEQKVIERRSGNFSGCSEEFELDKFDVVDFVQSCVDIFNSIDERILDNNWTKNEDDLIIKYYPQEGRECYKRLNNRTEKACALRASFLNACQEKRMRWTTEEDSILLKYYQKEGTECFKRIPNRTKISCENRVHKLKLSKRNNNYKKWKSEEIDILNKLYSKMGMGVKKYLDNRSDVEIRGKVRNLGLKINHNKSSKYKYVVKRYNKFHVSFKVDGTTYSFGYYDSEDEAGEVAIEKAKEYGKI